MHRYTTFLFILIAFLSCTEPKKPKFQESQGKIFNTSYHIKYLYTDTLDYEIKQKLNEFDLSLNPFNPSSVISRVNNNDKTVMLDSFFVNVINRSIEVSESSDGLFDITLAPLINVWGFGFDKKDEINEEILDSLRTFVGYEKIRIINNQLVKDDPLVNINTSAISKGYSCDVIANLLESYNIDHYMVEIGGEIRAKGYNLTNKCWKVAVAQPLISEKYAHTQQKQILLNLCDKALATSGNYYKYYIKDGKKYAHTIDPRTGYPSEQSILSATVIADDCMTADAFATVFMLADTAMTRIIAEKENLDYMLIVSDEQNELRIIKSNGFRSYIVE